MKNRLSEEISPYLQQHAGNPVAWQPWDDEALILARQMDRPIFLSIGYAACHWCHVMEHESFQDPAIADFMNRNFVNIKVDREERPDLDEIYMKTVVAMTGQGGWPMSVFLTPDLKPFYGGTYFPPERRYGMPSFHDVLEQIAAYWIRDRRRLLENGEHLVEIVNRYAQPVSASSDVTALNILQGICGELAKEYDEQYGGWGGAPKFPSSATIRVLLRDYQRNGSRYALEMATHTLNRMCCGGIYDHLGGGFHRYAVDEEWRVPHFEKMLYDNAQLAVAYLEAWQLTGRENYRCVVRETLDYLLRDMQDGAGGFYASQDADNEGGEGKFYLWTQDQIMACLGDDAGRRFCVAYDVRPGGNFLSHEECHRNSNVLFCKEPDGDYSALRHLLLSERCKRESPQRDEKVLTSWNALAISAFVKAGLAFNDTDYLNAALRAGNFLRDAMCKENCLMRAWRDGRAHLPGYLDDYAAWANACIDLYECTAVFEWIRLAEGAADYMLEHFYDRDAGGFHSTGKEHRHLLARMKPMQDTAEPSGNAQAALALTRLAVITGEEKYSEPAEKTFLVALPMIAQAPAAFPNLLLAMNLQHYGADEIVLDAGTNTDFLSDCLQIIGKHFIPNRQIIYAGESERQAGLPVVEGRMLAQGDCSVWICSNRNCSTPLNTTAALQAAMNQNWKKAEE